MRGCLNCPAQAREREMRLMVRTQSRHDCSRGQAATVCDDNECRRGLFCSIAPLPDVDEGDVQADRRRRSSRERGDRQHPGELQEGHLEENCSTSTTSSGRSSSGTPRCRSTRYRSGPSRTNGMSRATGDRIHCSRCLNLITNAIDLDDDERRTAAPVRSEVHDGRQGIDTGAGLGRTSTGYSIRCSPRNRMAWEWAFRFATRSSRHMIYRVWAAPNKPQGAVFEFILPADGAPPPGIVSVVVRFQSKSACSTNRTIGNVRDPVAIG